MEDDEDIIEETTEEQSTSSPKEEKKSRTAHLQPYQYKKGQSGNPSGRPEGISMKEYIKKKFRTMTDKEREDYLNGMNKKDVLEFGEGKAESKTDITSAGLPIIQIANEIAVKNAINTSPERNSEGQS